MWLQISLKSTEGDLVISNKMKNTQTSQSSDFTSRNLSYRCICVKTFILELLSSASFVRENARKPPTCPSVGDQIQSRDLTSAEYHVSVE